MVLDGQRMGDERDWVLVGFFVTCSSSAEKRFIRPAKQDEMGLWVSGQHSKQGQAGSEMHYLHLARHARPVQVLCCTN